MTDEGPPRRTPNEDLDGWIAVFRVKLAGGKRMCAGGLAPLQTDALQRDDTGAASVCRCRHGRPGSGYGQCGRRTGAGTIGSPFNVYLRSPALAERLRQLGEQIRF